VLSGPTKYYNSIRALVPLTFVVAMALLLAGVAGADEVAPINTAAPGISGVPLIGRVLHADAGSWSGDPQFAYQWRRCDAHGTDCEDIDQAVNATYRTDDADVGSALRVVVTASNDAGSTSSVSESSDVIGTGETVVDAPANATRYGYDAAGRLQNVIGHDAAAIPGDPLASAVYHWDAVGNLLSVARRDTAVTAVDEVSPDHGRPGTKVTIAGIGFSTHISQDTVRFAGTEAHVIDASATELVVIVPSGATDGAVTVVTPAGSATGPESFDATTERAPRIDSVSPTLSSSPGAYADSAPITITGAHFSPHLTDNVVTINGRRVILSSVSAAGDELLVKAPPGTGGGRVIVSTPDGTVTGPDVYIAQRGQSAETVDQTQRMTPGGAAGALSVAADHTSLVLFDGSAGQEITINATDTGSRAFANVIDPDGNQIATLGVGEGFENFMEAVSLPEDGTYTIAYTAAWAAGPAHATLKINDVGTESVDAQPTAAGTRVHLSSTVPGTDPGVRMNLHAGDAVSVATSNSTYGYANLRLVGPDGRQVAAGDAFTSGDGWLDAVTVPTDGRYTLRVDPQGPNTGAIDLTLWDATTKEATIAPDDDGDTVRVTTTAPGQDVRYTFDGHAGQRIAFKPTSDSEVGGTYDWVKTTLLAPDGSALESLWWITDTGMPVTLPTDGRYTIVVNPVKPRSGIVGMTAWDVPDDISQTVTPTQQGTDVTVHLTAPGQVANLHIQGHVGTKVSIRSLGSTYSYASLTWSRPNGSWAAGNGFGQGDAWLNNVRFDADGTWNLNVAGTGDSNTATGTVTLRIYDATDAAPTQLTPSANGATVPMTTTVPGQAAIATFTGRAGERVAFSTGDSTFANSWGTQGGFYDPNGGLVAYIGAGDHSRNGPYTLSANGTYTVTVNGIWDSIGSIPLTVYDIPDDQSATVTPTTSGATAHFDLVPWQMGKALVSAHAGERYSATISSQNSFSTAWENTTGGLIGPASWSSGNGFIDALTVSADSTIEAVVDPDDPKAGGSTDVTVYDASDIVRDLGDGGTTHLEFTTPGRNGRVTFDGHAGEVVNLDFPNSALNWWGQALYQPDGQQLYMSWGGNSSMTLPQDGRYTIIVDPYSSTLGSTDVSVTDLSGGASAARAAQARATAKVLRVPVGKGVGSHYRTLRAYLRGTRRTGAAKLTTTRTTAVPVVPKGVKLPARPKTLAEALGTPMASAAKAEAAKANGKHPKVKAVPVLSPRMRRPNGESEIWRPGRYDRRRGGWVTNRQPSEWARIPMLQGGLGVTAVAGQTLKLNGRPLKGVRVSVVGAEPVTTTDSAGRFLLSGVPAGKHTLRVEASAASKGDRRYGDYEIVETFKANVTTQLSQTVWVTRLDAAGDRRIPSTTTKAIRMTNPKIPGFEVRIPAGSRVTDRKGRVLHHLNLSAVPLDRPPFPLPAGITVSAYFTVQPGGAYFSKGAQVVYPNYHHLPARMRVTFWDYDAKDRGWFEYGRGSVTANGKQIVPDPGVRVWKLSGAMAATNPNAPAQGTSGEGAEAGDPVDLRTGILTYKHTDLSIRGSMPLDITRVYNQFDNNSYPLGGRSFSTVLDSRLIFRDFNDRTRLWLVLAGGGTVEYDLVSGPAGGDGSVYAAQRGGDQWAGSTARLDGTTWRVKKLDGSGMEFAQGEAVSALVDKSGQRMTISRDSRNIIGSSQQINFPDGRWVLATRDDIWDSAGRHVHYEYDSQSRLTEVVDSDGNITHYGWTDDLGDHGGMHDVGRLTRVIDGRGKTILSNEYDAYQGYVSKQTTADGGVYRFDYTCGANDHWIWSEIENRPMPDPLFKNYCDYANVVNVTYPNGRVDRFFPKEGSAWDKVSDVGNANLTDDQRRHEWVITDDEGRIVDHKVTMGLSYSNTLSDVRYHYDGSGDLVGVTTRVDATHDRTVALGYTNHDVTSVTDPAGKTATLAYDARHRLTRYTDATQRSVALSYGDDGDPRPRTMTWSGGQRSRFGYRMGDLESVTDPLGNVTSINSDAVGYPNKVTDPLGRATRHVYSPNGLLLESTDPKGRKTQYEYDPNGKVTKVTDARGNATRATYDDQENLASITDADGATETIEHNSAGEVTSKTDRRGNRTVFRYDIYKRPTFIGYGAHGANGDEYDSTATLEWDDLNRLTKVDDSESGVTEYTYNAVDEPLTITAAGLPSISYNYDADGRVAAAQVGDRDPTTYGYDDAGRLTNVAQGAVAAAFSYDVNGARTGATLPNGVTLADTLDADGRLVSRRYSASIFDTKTINYAYDADSRRVASWGELDPMKLPDAVPSSTYDDANRLLSRGSVTPTYDADGHLTSDGTRSLAWDDRGRLASVTGGGHTVQYGFDAGDRPALVTADGTTTKRSYVGFNVVQESQDGGPTTNILAGLAPDDVLATTSGGQTTTLLQDALGTTAATATSSGASATNAVTPFGVGAATGSRWAGGAIDASGLVDRRLRSYDPSLGTFTSEDPAGASADANLYAYTWGDPTNYTDPYGLFGLSDIGHALGDAGKFAYQHEGTITAIGAAGVCVAATAGTCGFAIVSAAVINQTAMTAKLATGDSSWEQYGVGTAFNVVGTALGAGGVKVLDMADDAFRAGQGLVNAAAEEGEHLLEGATEKIVGQIVGLPSTILGLLDIGTDDSGELATGLGG
jgi:RHS repeat-associated protein